MKLEIIYYLNEIFNKAFEWNFYAKLFEWNFCVNVYKPIIYFAIERGNIEIIKLLISSQELNINLPYVFKIIV